MTLVRTLNQANVEALNNDQPVLSGSNNLESFVINWIEEGQRAQEEGSVGTPERRPLNTEERRALDAVSESSFLSVGQRPINPLWEEKKDEDSPPFFLKIAEKIGVFASWVTEGISWAWAQVTSAVASVFKAVRNVFSSKTPSTASTVLLSSHSNESSVLTVESEKKEKPVVVSDDEDQDVKTLTASSYGSSSSVQITAMRKGPARPQATLSPLMRLAEKDELVAAISDTSQKLKNLDLEKALVVCGTRVFCSSWKVEAKERTPEESRQAREEVLRAEDGPYKFVSVINELNPEKVVLRDCKWVPQALKAKIALDEDGKYNIKEGGFALSILVNNHYVSLYLDFANGKAYYYDPLSPSAGISNQKREFVNKVLEKFRIPQDKLQLLCEHHQEDGINCGRYSLFFLAKMMMTKNPARTLSLFRKDKFSAAVLQNRLTTFFNRSVFA